MSRFGEGDGEEFAGQYELWRANVRRALAGRKGQAALRDLEAALLALPAPRLIHGHLAHNGEVCAVGALVVHRRTTRGEDRALVLADLEELAPTLCICNHPEREHVDGICQGCVERTHWWNEARDHPSNQGRLSLDGKPWFDPSHAPSLCSKFEDTGETDDYGDVTVEAGKQIGLSYVLAWEIAWHNDEAYSSLTPEQRFDRTLEWVRTHLKKEEATVGA